MELLQSAASIKDETVKKAADATPVRSPEMFTPMEGPGETVRHTPGGTRVPPGTPPEVDENMDGGARNLAGLPPVPPWPLEPTGQTKRAHDESFWKIFESGLTVWKEYHRNRPYQGEPVGSGASSGAVQQHHLRGPGEFEGGAGPRHELPHQQCGEQLGKKENWVDSETRESGAASWDVVDDQFDKSWMGTTANQQAAKMQWLERELNELRGRVQQQEQGASLGAGPMKIGQQPNEVPDEPLSSETKLPPPTSKVGNKECMDGGVKDDLRSVNVVLPRLPEEGAHQAALKCGDWIAEITPLVHDVSSFAGQWWNQLMEHVGQVCKQWLLASDPLTRLAVEVETMPNQPGGLSEKSALLKGLQSPAPATNAADAIEKLRGWNRSIIRAGELGVTLPDPVLQVHALDLTREAQVSFRIQTWRHQHGLDVRPTQSTVNQFSLLLQAEMTTISLTSNTESKGNNEAKVKQLQTSPTQSATAGAKPCRFSATSSGCSRCKFAHSWDGVEDEPSRCWECSSLEHRKSACPTAVDKSDKGSGEAKKDGFKGKSKGNGGKAKPQVNKTDGAAGPKSPETPAVQGGGSDGAVEASEKAGNGGGTSTLRSSTASSTSTTEAVNGGAGGSENQLLGEVTSLLRSLRAPQPAIRALIAKVNHEAQGVLLDSGATHILRQSSSDRG